MFEVDASFLDSVEFIALQYRSSGQCILYATVESILDTIKELREGQGGANV
jgi:hypothetical protein